MSTGETKKQANAKTTKQVQEDKTMTKWTLKDKTTMKWAKEEKTSIEWVIKDKTTKEMYSQQQKPVSKHRDYSAMLFSCLHVLTFSLLSYLQSL